MTTDEALALVPEIVEQFVGRYPQYRYLHDDLLSEGNIGALKGVAALHTDVKQPEWYVKRAIWNALQRCVYQETESGYSDETCRHKHKNGDSIPQQEPLEEDVIAPDTQATLQDVLDCCHTTSEQLIVTMRANGLTDREIAEKLNISRAAVQRRRKQLKERFYAS